MANIESNIEIWKKKLLDLGKKNRLLNYRDTKRSNISITSPDIDTLYNKLVIKEQRLLFPYPIDGSNSNEDFEEVNNPKQRTLFGDLETDRSVSEQQKTLRVLRGRAKTAIEEQGVNILYLSFGFLNWKERQDSDQIIKSPLVLVPVILSLESITSPFALHLHEDEIVLNPTLVYKLENDFGVKLPEFDTNEENIDKYLSNISILAIHNGWELTYETGLSLLSFLKINMYRDLENNKDRISSHQIIKALSGENNSLNSLPDDFDNWDHDKKEIPVETFEVLNADPSQQDAILYSKKGISYVLQGPPGTGKSQTITNIISESLASGKKVLFVSEKMAALEVVHKRLNETGLSDFCLNLHSHKANKKEVLAELGKTLSFTKFRIKNEAIDQLELLRNEREQLNLYDTQLHTQCTPLNKEIYEINGELAKLSNLNIPDIIFPIENVKSTDSEKFLYYTKIITELARTLGKMKDDYFDNVWWDCTIQDLTHEIRGDIDSKLSSLLPKLKIQADQYFTYINEFHLNNDSSIKKIDQLIIILNISAKSPRVPSDWINKDNILPLVESANAYNNLVSEYKMIREELTNHYNENFLRLPANQTHTTLFDLFIKVEQQLDPDSFQNYSEIERNIKALINFLEKSISNISALININEDSYNKLGVRKIKTLQDAVIFVHFFELILSNPKAPSEWFIDEKFSLVKRLNYEVRNLYQEVENETISIKDRFDNEILNIDYSSMLKRFKTDYTNIFKIIRKDYRLDKKLIKSLSNNTDKQINDLTIITILNELKNLHGNKSAIKAKENLLISLFGNNYQYEYTDWSLINNQICVFEKIKEYFFPNEISDQVKKGLTTGFAKGFDEYQIQYNSIKFLLDESFVKEITRNIKLPEHIENIEIEILLILLKKVLSNILYLDKFYSKVKEYSNEEISVDFLFSSLIKLERLQEIIKQVESNNIELTKSYHFLFNGIDTDWKAILRALVWTKEFRDIKVDYSLSDAFINNVCGNVETISSAERAHNHMVDLRSAINHEWEWFLSIFDNHDKLMELNLDSLIERITNCKNDLVSLEQWIDFRSCREKCQGAGLSQFLSIVEKNKIQTNQLFQVFKKRFYRLWLDAVIPDFPAVQNFRRISHEEVIKNFSKHDISQLTIAQKRVKERLVSRLPDIDRLSAAYDEVSILKRELTKQRKIMPLRKLFKQIPNLLLTLKPCFMMSPLSVSLFLEENFYDFDIIIFDEASQVRTEDAIGSLMRGKQVVIAGDSKQLPPTSFFSASISGDDFDLDNEDDDPDNYEDTDAYESILDEALSVLPQRTLRWHYRSRHESLIAFSNSKIYNNSLFTFPASIQKEDDLGVEYIFVPDGVYDRSGRRNNLIEAKKVAEIVFDQIKNHSKRSIGVVTFSEAQQQTVEDAIRRLRLQNQQYELFFNEDNEEPFFVKNLENVQGDERDTIIFSIGYAKDSRGIMHMNFGPLGKSGGYRRLNVAITRAKFNVKLVGSIQPTDILLENCNSEGVKMLRSYIEYAKDGQRSLDRELKINSGAEFESPFEEAVYSFLIDQGYQIETQIGCSGYRIDLGVKHPSLNGRFTLGIECDGASYHSARTARERDRLRQTQLEDIGWKIYRIWSTDWVKDPYKEGKKLLEVVDDSILNYSDSDLGSKKKENDLENIPKSTDSLIEKIPEGNTLNITGMDKYNFSYYEESNLRDVPRKYNETNEAFIANVIRHILQKEYPIHIDLLNQRIAPLFGRQKATSVIRNSVLFVISMNLSREIENRNDFYWPKSERKLTVRVPKGDVGLRPIKYICTEEIAKAMYAIVKDSFGIMQKDLTIATARVFGFNRSGNNISESLEESIKYLITFKLITISDGKVIITPQPSKVNSK